MKGYELLFGTDAGSLHVGPDVVFWAVLLIAFTGIVLVLSKKQVPYAVVGVLGVAGLVTTTLVSRRHDAAFTLIAIHSRFITELGFYLAWLSYAAVVVMTLIFLLRRKPPSEPPDRRRRNLPSSLEGG